MSCGTAIDPVAPGCEVVSKLTATDHFLMVALRFLAAG